MAAIYTAPWEAFRSGFDAYGQVIEDQRRQALTEAEVARWKEQQRIAAEVESRRAAEEADWNAFQTVLKGKYDEVTQAWGEEDPERNWREAWNRARPYAPSSVMLKQVVPEIQANAKALSDQLAMQRALGVANINAGARMYGADVGAQTAQNRLLTADEWKRLDRELKTTEGEKNRQLRRELQAGKFLNDVDLAYIRQAAKGGQGEEIGTTKVINDPVSGKPRWVSIRSSGNQVRIFPFKEKLSDEAKLQVPSLLRSARYYESEIANTTDEAQRARLETELDKVNTQLKAILGDSYQDVDAGWETVSPAERREAEGFTPPPAGAPPVPANGMFGVPVPPPPPPEARLDNLKTNLNDVATQLKGLSNSAAASLPAGGARYIYKNGKLTRVQ